MKWQSVPALAATATLLAAIAAMQAGAADHPSLVDPAATTCTTCHAQVLSKKVRHPPAADDCRTCHQFEKKEGRTSVSLADKLPGLCVTCHGDESKPAAGDVAAPHPPVTDSCTNCHNAHSADQPALLNDAVPSLCIACHGAEEINKSHKRTVSTTPCTRCHTAHGSDVKGMLVSDKQHPPFADRSCQACHRQGTIARSRPKSDICFACHTRERFTAKATHTAVREGKCTGCHDPHLSSNAKLVRASGAALCVTCHAPIRERIESARAHPPARDDCTTCHDPHKSDHANQLVDAVPALCLTCHDAADAELVRKHLGADLTRAACTSCHDPHGSRDPGLLAGGSVHPPFAERSCKTCHEGKASRLVANGTKDLCFACHGGIRQRIETAATQHPALEVAECTECHTPHASKQARLLRFPAGRECTSCHADKTAGEGEFAHGATIAIGCRGCHEPHGGDRPRLLRADADKICLGCHDASQRKKTEGKEEVVLLAGLRLSGARVALADRIPSLTVIDGVVRNHPVTGHRATGTPTPEELKLIQTTFKGELGCLSCHDPHKGPSRTHFAGGAKSSAELCLKCHKK